MSIDVFVEGSEGGDESFENWRVAVSYSLAALCLAVFCVTAVFLVVVAKTRKFTYNVYIIFLLLPDAFLNLLLGIRCIYDGILNGRSLPPIPLCAIHYIGIGSHFSIVMLNGIISMELYTMAKNSYHRKRTKPPTIRKILFQVVVVYGIGGLIIIWNILPVEWAGMNITNDPYCGAMRRKATEKIAHAVYLCVLVPPVVIAVFTHTRMIRGLLPKTGRTRALAFYFFRIFGQFVGFYMPLTIVLTLYIEFDADRRDSDAFFWLLSATTFLNPVQSIVSLVIFWQKDDIQQTFYHYTSKMRTLISIKDSNSAGVADTIPTKAKGAWSQDDTYECSDGRLSVVRYCHSESLRINGNDDENEDDIADGI